MDVPAPADPGGPADDLAPVVHEEVQRLPELYREVIVRHYLLGQTYDAIAASLACPKGTVATRLAEAKRRLRGRLAARGVGAAAAALPLVLAPHPVPAAALSAAAAPATAPAAVLAGVGTGKLAAAAAAVLLLGTTLGLTVFPGRRSPGPAAPSAPSEVKTVTKTTTARPQPDRLGPREVPAVLSGSIPGQGAWAYDTAADVLTVTGNGGNNGLGVVGNHEGSVKINYGTATGTGSPFARTVDTRVVPTGRTVIRIDGGGGNDHLRFTYAEPPGGDRPAPVARVEILGGAGNDLLEHQRLGPQTVAVPLTADGGPGDDKLDFAGTLVTGVGRPAAGSPLLGSIRLAGGAGNDQIRFDERAAAVTGGGGSDRFIFNIGQPVTLAQFRSQIGNDFDPAADTFAGSGQKADGFQ